MRRLYQGSALAVLFASSRAAAESAHEVTVNIPGGGALGLSTRGPSAFRIRFLWGDAEATRLDSPMVGPDRPDAAFEELQGGAGGIRASFGTVQVSEDGELSVANAAGQQLTVSSRLDATINAMSLSTQEASLYGRGASPEDCGSLTTTSSRGRVCNRGTYAPYYFSTDGYSALGVTESTRDTDLQVEYTSDGKSIMWNFKEAANFELYIMPAGSLRQGTQAYYELIGAPRVPPRYAFGFMASRWGWESRTYIEDALAKFRTGKFPIDAIICDFEWFTNVSDYGFKPNGVPWYNDFGFNPDTYDQPREQLQEYRSKYHIRVGGIRKPRLGSTANLEMAHGKNWTLPDGEAGGTYPPDWAQAYAKDRCLDFRLPAVREWYSQQMAHFVDDGMSFWWNDEGETNYFTFYWWNVAQIDALRMRDKYRRFYSLNRAWSPGMARLGATVWTGDIDPTWEDLQGTPGMMLNWVLGGAPYVACDIGGFTGQTNAVLLTRWFQVGVFMPTMRVHSTIDTTPHFPWLWGEPAAAAMRNALDLRYRLIPYHYSLAHRLFSSSDLWVKPLVYEFPGDARAAGVVEAWMDGDILVAPVLSADAKVQVYVPSGTWYPLAASTITHGGGGIIQGPTSVERDVGFDEIPAYVRAGTVLPLAPVVQSTAELPGGPLEVQVYLGTDGSFDLVEDDGESTHYEQGHSRMVKFRWHEDTKKFTWAISGHMLAQATNSFTHLFVTFIDEHGSTSSKIEPIGAAGSISPGDLEQVILQ